MPTNQTAAEALAELQAPIRQRHEVVFVRVATDKIEWMLE